MSIMLYSMYLAENRIEKCPCPQTEHKGIMTLREDRVGKGGRGAWRGARGGGGGVLLGGGSLRHRFSADLEAIIKLLKIIFGYFRL